MKHLSILLLTITLSGCFQNEPPLEYNGPLFPLTLTGEDRIACLYNKEIWVPDTPKAMNIISTLDSTSNRLIFDIRAFSNYKALLEISLQFEVELDTRISYVTEEIEILSSTVGCSNFTSDEYPKYDIVKLDTGARIISGYFEFPNLINDCSETAEITKGRFDLSY